MGSLTLAAGDEPKAYSAVVFRHPAVAHDASH